MCVLHDIQITHSLSHISITQSVNVDIDLKNPWFPIRGSGSTKGGFCGRVYEYDTRVYACIYTYTYINIHSVYIYICDMCILYMYNKYNT